VKAFSDLGIESLHWSAIGEPDSLDKEILAWAAINSYVVFTHDLDFGTLLAANKTTCPSVIQIRTQDVSPAALLTTVTLAIEQFKDYIENGALITIDKRRARVKILPIN
jgi:predicted nuclease of predicted toxin-antitoxin system